MPQSTRIQCDGCRQMFSVEQLRAHLRLDRVEASRAQLPKEMNPRGNRLTTAPPVNLHDPRICFDLCPQRAERVGRAGPLNADLRAPESLPIFFPFPMSKLQCETLKETLLNAWEARRKEKANLLSQAAMEEAALPPSDSSSYRPRQGRHVLVDDVVKKMHSGKQCENPKVAPPQQTAPVTKPASPAAPSYMAPLKRGLKPSIAPTAICASRPVAGKQVHCDPVAVGNPKERDRTGFTRLVGGQVTPIYVRQ